MPLELRTVIPHFMAHIVKMKVRETSPIIAQERENLVFSFRTKIVIFRHQISSWLKTSLSEWWQTHLLDIPCGLVARIRRSHRRGRGSIPRKGVLFVNMQISVLRARISCHDNRQWWDGSLVSISHSETYESNRDGSSNFPFALKPLLQGRLELPTFAFLCQYWLISTTR